MSLSRTMQDAMSAALASGDTAKIEAAALAITKSKADRHKTEVETLRLEAETMAGIRELEAAAILKDVSSLNHLLERLTTVKATGFTFTAKGTPIGADKVPQEKSSVALSVPSVRTTRSGGTGGGGKTKDETGMSLSEVYDTYATEADEAKMVEAEAADNKHAVEHGLATAKQSNRWRVKNDVKKRVLADGTLPPVK